MGRSHTYARFRGPSLPGAPSGYTRGACCMPTAGGRRAKGTEALPSAEIPPPPPPLIWGPRGLSTLYVFSHRIKNTLYRREHGDTGQWPKVNQLPERCRWNSDRGSWPHSPIQAVTLSGQGTQTTFFVRLYRSRPCTRTYPRREAVRTGGAGLRSGNVL